MGFEYNEDKQPWFYGCCTVPIRNWNINSGITPFIISVEMLYRTYKELKHSTASLKRSMSFPLSLYRTYKELKLNWN